MRFDVVLADMDNTLFDFNADSRQAVKATFERFGFPYSEEERELYFSINHQLWADFEQGRIEKSFIFPTRWQRYMDRRGLSGDPAEVNKYYMEQLAKGSNYMPDAHLLLKTLNDMGCKVCAATNGATHTQQPRLQRSGMLPYFHKVYISEQMGTQKPSREYFDLIFADLGEDKRKTAIVLGDSLSSDMQGGRNAGIATCFFGDPGQADGRCDYVITELMQFVDIIK